MRVFGSAHVGANPGAPRTGSAAIAIWCAVVLWVVAWVVPGWAQNLDSSPNPAETGMEQQSSARPDDDGEGEEPDQAEAADSESEVVEAADHGRYKQIPNGPSSVKAQILEDKKPRRFEKLQAPKERLQSQYGLSLGADLNVLMHQISESPGPNDGVTGVARFYGHWALVGRDDPTDVGSLVFKIEYRDALGTDIPAQAVLPTAGVAGVSGPTFGANRGMLTNLYWTQAFASNRFAFNAGVVDPTDYLDVYGLVNVWTDFNNLAFSTNPTIQIPNQGLGAVARWMFTPHFYVVGGFSDANADPHRPEDYFDTFGEGEYFKHIEFGWIGSWRGRFSDNAHVTLWEVDDREEAAIEGGWGATVSWSENVGEQWLAFVRAGYSDSGGTLVDRTVSTGFGYKINEEDHYFGFGVNWGRAPEVDRDQYMFETYYRGFVFPGLSVVPSVQYILDPAYNPDVSNLWLMGIRLRAVW